MFGFNMKMSVVLTRVYVSLFRIDFGENINF